MAVVRYITGFYFTLVTALSVGVLSVCTSNAVQAGETLPNPYDAFRLAEMTPETQLPLLGDRFRIDHHVDEITMVFFRNQLSDPVVLILPDGSKWYHSRHPDTVEWETGIGFDQVRIESPMRGPWQVSGDLHPQSRLLVISDLKFHAEPLPEHVYQGERLAIEGRFSEAGEPIEQRDFRSAMSMQMHLISTNQSEYENFALQPRAVGEFLDDGRGLDGRARDGVFTGEVAFDVPTGEYIPSYHAVTPLYQRTFEQLPIRVHAFPVETDVEVSNQEGRAHRLTFKVDSEYFDPADVVIRGEVEFPNGEIQRIDMRSAEGLYTRIPNRGEGNFVVRAQVFATSVVDGREVIAELNDYQFNVRPAQPPGPTDEELAAQRQAQREAEISQRVASERAALRQQRYLLIAIVVVNTVLVIGWIWFLLWRRTKRTAAGLESKKKAKK